MSAGLLSPWLGDPDLVTFLLQVSVFFSVKWEQIPPPSQSCQEEKVTSAQSTQ